MRIFIFISILLIAANAVYAQNLCDGHEKPIGGVAKELLKVLYLKSEKENKEYSMLKAP